MVCSDTGASHHDTLCNATLDDQKVYGGQSHAVGKTFTVDFVKGAEDNPKVCAILLVKGSKVDALALAPLNDLAAPEDDAPEVDVDEYNDDEEEDFADDEYSGT